MKKNVASQVIGAQMVNASSGAAFTGAVTVYVTGDAGTQAIGSVGGGACTHEGNGFHSYAPAQAETNYDHIAFTFIGTGAIPATVQVYPSFPQTGDNYVRLGAPVGASISADVAGVQSDTNDIQARLPAALGANGNIKADVRDYNGTAGTFAGGRPEVNVSHLLGTAWLTPGTAGTPDVNVKLWNGLTTVALPLVPTTAGRTLDVSVGGEAGVDWANVGSPTTAVNLSATNIDVDQIVASVSGAVGSVTGNVGGNVIGSVASVIATVAADVVSISGDSAAADNAEAFFDGTGYRDPDNLYVIRSATAQAGAAGTITLDASASGTDDFYNNTYLQIVGGTGVGQARFISDYVGATKVATVNSNWATNPDSSSVFIVWPFGSIPGASAPSAADIWAHATRTLTAIDEDTTTIDLDATIRGAVGLSAADLDAQLGDIDGRLPATLVSGRMDANVGAIASGVDLSATMKASINTEVDTALVDVRLDELLAADSDIDGAAPPTVGSVFHELMTKTAGSFTYDQTTDSLEALRDRGDAAWITATGFSTLDAAGVRAAVGMASANLDTQLADIDGRTVNILGDVSNVQTIVDTIDGKVDTIDNFIDTEVAAIKAVTDKVDSALELDGAVYRYTTNALEQAPTGGSAPTAAQVADAVWDEVVSGHLSAGTFGRAVDDTDDRGSRTVIRGTVSGASPSTTGFTAAALSPEGAAANQFKGRIIIFDNDTATATLRGQATDITANTGDSLPVFTFTALTHAPASGDTFSIV